MKRFIINIAIFSLVVLGFYLVTYKAFYKITTPTGKNVVYLWGDSQTYEDIDLNYINSNSPYHFYSAARHGSGLYNFLVFSELVPDNSDVIVQISQTALIRRKEVDFNISALDIDALRTLKSHNYTFEEMYQILKSNLVPNSLYIDQAPHTAVRDTITLAEPLSLFTTTFGTKPIYFNDKKNLYFAAIDNLLRKHCRVIGLVFPFHPILDSIKSNSPYITDLTQFENEVVTLFPRRQTINLQTKENIFFDLTHMNARGAHALSSKLISTLDFRDEPMLIEVKKQL